MKLIAVDEQTCQECADFLSLVERQSEADTKSVGLLEQALEDKASQQAATRLGLAPFEYEERN